MPKIRKKIKNRLKEADGDFSTDSNGDYIYPEKSGVLSKSFKKIIEEQDSMQGKIPAEKFFNNQEKELKSIDYITYLDPDISTSSSTDHIIFDSNKYSQDNDLIYFDDSFIHNLGPQRVNSTLGVDSRLIENHRSYSSPNRFTQISTFETDVDKLPNAAFYDLRNNNISEENYSPFTDNLIKENTRKEIIIDLPFKFDLQFDNLIDTKNSNVDGGRFQKFSRGLSTPETYKNHPLIFADKSGFPKQLVYYNFNKMGWDYIVDPDGLEFLGTQNDVGKSYIPHFTPSSTPAALVSSSSIGLPVQNLGFPWRQEFTAGYENLFYLGNYISSNFILEEVIFETTISSRCETRYGFEVDENTDSASLFNTSNNVDLSNSIDFFILNQRTTGVNVERYLKNIVRNVVTASFDYNNLNNLNGLIEVGRSSPRYFSTFVDADLRRYQNSNDFHEGSTRPAGGTDLSTVLKTPYSHLFKSMQPDTRGHILSPLNNKKLNAAEQMGELIASNDPDLYEKAEQIAAKIFPSNREIITFNTFLTYNNYTQENTNTDWLNASKEVNCIYKFEEGDSISNAHINFTKVNFEISGSTVKSNKYENGSAFSYYKNVDYIEAALEFQPDTLKLNERSVYFCSNKFGERDLLGNLSGRDTTTFSNSSKILSRKEYSLGGNSIIHNNIANTRKKDAYVLHPDDTIVFGIHSFSNLDEFPALFTIHDNLRVRLIGRYENVDDSNITLSNKRGMTSNSVRSSIIGNTTVVNQYDTEPIYFMSGSYLDSKFNGDIRVEPRTIVGSLSSGKEGSFTRTVALTSTENTIYDSMMPNILDIVGLKNKNLLSFSDSPGFNAIWMVEDVVSSLESDPEYNLFDMNSWYYEFPFDEAYKNLSRYIEIDLNNSTKNKKYEPAPNVAGVNDFDPSLPVRGIFQTFPQSLENTNYYTPRDQKIINNVFFGAIYNTFHLKEAYESNPSLYKFNPPISRFKYGVYNANPVSLTKHFNWKSYGQFSDLYNGTIDTAFFNKDRTVDFPVRKIILDRFLDIVDLETTEVDTYNTDEYSRLGRPFFD